ncbi:MAG: hypothetical protein ACLRMJ_08425 [Alistipes finegoldii]
MTYNGVAPSHQRRQLQMIADMMTEGKADLVISELTAARSHRPGLPAQEIRRTDGQGVELRIFAAMA